MHYTSKEPVVRVIKALPVQCTCTKIPKKKPARSAVSSRQPCPVNIRPNSIFSSLFSHPSYSLSCFIYTYASLRSSTTIPLYTQRRKKTSLLRTYLSISSLLSVNKIDINISSWLVLILLQQKNKFFSTHTIKFTFTPSYIQQNCLVIFAVL